MCTHREAEMESYTDHVKRVAGTLSIATADPRAGSIPGPYSFTEYADHASAHGCTGAFNGISPDEHTRALSSCSCSDSSSFAGTSVSTGASQPT